jgi:hypothetical protein
MPGFAKAQATSKPIENHMYALARIIRLALVTTIAQGMTPLVLMP